MRNKGKNFLNARFVVFLAKPIERPEILSSGFVEKLGDIFDQSPLTTPIPNLPEYSSIPVVQYKSSNNLHYCSFARQRIDYFHYSSDQKKRFELEDIRDNFLRNIEKFISFLESNSLEFGRIAFITQFFIEDEDSGNSISKLLNNKFVDLFSGTPRSAGLQYINRSMEGDFEVNDNTKVEKKENMILYGEEFGKTKRSGILVTRDFNTIPEKSDEYLGRFNIDTIKSIIEYGEKNFKLEKILDLL